MVIEQISLFDSMSGKLNKKHKIVFSKRYGRVHAWEVNPYKGPWTANQLLIRQAFSQTHLAVTDLLSTPEAKAHWKQVAAQSNGKYKTARGAAFAAQYPTILEQLKAAQNA